MMNQAQGLAQLSAPLAIDVIAVTSGKGGVGKTNIAINLAVSMADQGRQVLLFDADLGSANQKAWTEHGYPRFWPVASHRSPESVVPGHYSGMSWLSFPT